MEALEAVLEARVMQLAGEFQLSIGDGDAMGHASTLLSKVPPGRLVQGMVVSLALDSRGCRLLQDAMEVCDSFTRRELLMEFQGHVRKALESPHANHVLQRAVELMAPTTTRFLLDELTRTWDLASVVQHKFGCRLLERVFEHFTASRESSQDLTFYLSNGSLVMWPHIVFTCSGHMSCSMSWSMEPLINSAWSGRPSEATCAGLPWTSTLWECWTRL